MDALLTMANMKNTTLALTFAVAAIAAPAAFGMHYKLEIAGPILPPAVGAPPPPHVVFSGCSADSNTIAVGIDWLPNGIRMLCADAGRIGFWTTPVTASAIGSDAGAPGRMLCPSGMAISGLIYTEGLIFPMPVCSILVPNYVNGTVARHFRLVDVNEQPTGNNAVACPGSDFVQSLKSVNGSIGPVCTPILTTARSANDPEVDLAARTFSQRATLGTHEIEGFGVEMINLGAATLPSTAALLEIRFDSSVWNVTPNGNFSCTTLSAHKGPVDLITVGIRCTLPTSAVPSSGIAANGGGNTLGFAIQPVGAGPHPSATPAPILSVTALLVDSQFAGPDADDTNDRAAFPVRVVQ